jgi:hypothetical protein
LTGVASEDLRRAFGVGFVSEVVLPALPVADQAPTDPTRVVLADPAQLDAAWPEHEAVRVVQEGEPGSPLERSADRHGTAGWRLRAGGFGEAIISADGRRVTAARGDATPERFERLLVGRVLPWTALVRGLEIFHAAAVTLDQGAVLLVGPSGVGKTSLAVQLTLAGAAFLTDDVLAVDRDGDGRLRAHPGARLAGLRAAERDRLSTGDRSALGALRELDDKSWATLPASGTAGGVPFRAICFITRPTDPDPTEPELEPLAQPSAEPLLASTFVTSVRTPARLANLLDVCADLATSVPWYRVRVTPGRDARSLAGLLADAV